MKLSIGLIVSYMFLKNFTWPVLNNVRILIKVKRQFHECVVI